MTNIEQAVFNRTHRVSLDDARQGHAANDAEVQVRQLDAVLMSIGYKLSTDLVRALTPLDPAYVIDKAVKVIAWSRELAGAHVRHNAYFIDFPENVPDTLEFWAECMRDAVLVGANVRGGVAVTLGGRAQFFVDLLSLPKYGRYQHTYEEMLEHHAELEPLLADRMTLVHLGGPAADEAAVLYSELAGSAVPLSGSELDLLRVLAEACIGMPTQSEIKVRENRAVVNAVRVRAGVEPLVTTVTDVLRLAAELCGTDVTLATAPKFTSLPRVQRAALMLALQGMSNEHGLGEAAQRGELWKRLGERVHPHEFGQYPAAQLVFAVARGEYPARSLASHVEAAFRSGNPKGAAGWMTGAPGMLWRNADRVLRTISPHDVTAVMGYFEATAPDVAGRVLLGTRQHLMNRVRPTDVSRVFTNRRGRAWVAADNRAVLDEGIVRELNSIIDEEVLRRVPETDILVVDPGILGAALPLSNKATAEGLGVWPRGSVIPLDAGSTLRFFTYWRQRAHRTDYDLSALFTDEQFGSAEHISYTRLHGGYGVHSGDIVDAPAPDGATEFIDVTLDKFGRGYIVPQVYIFTGEGFQEVEENFFGFMTREREQRGAPFEARTVRMKSVMNGEGKTAMPLAFYRGEDGRMYAKWLHLYLKGQAAGLGGYRIEENRVTTQLLARSIMQYDYLRAGYIVSAMKRRAGTVLAAGDDIEVREGQKVTFLGIEQTDNVPAGADVISLASLARLVPA